MTPAQVKQSLRDKGITLTQWAKDNGYSRFAVYRVLNGLDKAHYGKAHEIAVKLGLKDDEADTSTESAMTLVEVGNHIKTALADHLAQQIQAFEQQVSQWLAETAHLPLAEQVAAISDRLTALRQPHQPGADQQ